MQVLFSFLKNILQDLAGFPMDKTSLLLPFKGDFQKKTGYRPQKRNDTLLYDSFICECRGCAA